MESWSRRVTVQATPSKVFEVLSEPDHAPRIMPDIIKIKALTEGPLGPGYRWRETRRFKALGFIPLHASAEIEIAEFEPGERYKAVADDGCNRAAYTFTTRGAGAGATTVELLAEFEGVGRFAGNERVAKRLANWCKRSDGDLLERLKVYIES